MNISQFHIHICNYFPRNADIPAGGGNRRMAEYFTKIDQAFFALMITFKNPLGEAFTQTMGRWILHPYIVMRKYSVQLLVYVVDGNTVTPPVSKDVTILGK